MRVSDGFWNPGFEGPMQLTRRLIGLVTCWADFEAQSSEFKLYRRLEVHGLLLSCALSHSPPEGIYVHPELRLCPSICWCISLT